MSEKPINDHLFRADSGLSRDREGAVPGAARDQEPLPDGRGSDLRRGSAPSPPVSNPLSAHSEALAYFITFRTYGTWLHGRADGSVDRTHNAHGTPTRGPDAKREQEESERLKFAPVRLDAKMRGIFAQALREVCAHRGWSLHAINVRTNHVHLVVTGPAKPERIMNDFKAYATRRLKEAGLAGSFGKAWSRHGSTVYLWSVAAVHEKCRYVTEGQGADLP